MAQTEKTALEESIDLVNLYAGTDFSYDRIKQTLDSIYALEGERRDAEMKKFYFEVAEYALISNARYRGLSSINQSFATKYANYMRSDSVAMANTVMAIFDQYCQERGGEYVFNATTAGITPEERRDLLANSIKTATIMKVRREHAGMIKAADAIEEFDVIKSGNSDHMYTNDINNDRDRGINEIYLNMTLQEENHRKHGFAWKLFHPIENYRLNKYISNARSFLDSVGFDEQRHGRSVIEHAESNTIPSVEADNTRIKSEYKGAIERRRREEKRKSIKQITYARDKRKAAYDRELDDGGFLPREASKTSIMSELKPIFEKYAIKIPRIGVSGVPTDYSLGGEVDMAEKFDTMRETDDCKAYVKFAFHSSFSKLLNATLKSGDVLDISEILKDASKISTAIIDRYTFIYDAEETKDEALNSTFGYLTSDDIYERVVKAIKAEKALPGKYDLEEIKRDIETTMAEYKNPYLRDDVVKGDDLPSKKENEKAIADDKERVQISVLEVKEGDREVSQQILQDESPVKTSEVKI